MTLGLEELELRLSAVRYMLLHMYSVNKPLYEEEAKRLKVAIMHVKSGEKYNDEWTQFE